MKNNQQNKPRHSDYFQPSQAGIGPRDIERINTYFTFVSAKKGELLLREQEICETLYFVKSGSARTYHLTALGSEKTRYIALEGSFITALGSFISGKPSFEWVEAIEDCELFFISRKDFYGLLEKLPELNITYRQFIERAYIHQNSKIESLVTLSAKQRYEKLLLENPMMVQRLPGKIIASYLDIAPETLSRLKHKA